MLSIEEYIARRKKEDRLNEFDIESRAQNMKICVDYVFEYFNNYLNITEAEEKTVLHNEKLEKYRNQLREYDPEVREWAVSIYNEYGKQIHRYIGSIMKENELFFIYNTDSEFRNASYDCYSRLIKRLPFLKDQTECQRRSIITVNGVRTFFWTLTPLNRCSAGIPLGSYHPKTP